MIESLWDWSLSELRAATASAAPTPGGGSVAAVTGVLGASLLVMAVEVTLRSDKRRPDAAHDLPAARERLLGLSEQMAAAADADVATFENLMAGYQMPRGSDAEKALRRKAIRSAAIEATEIPLALAECCASAIEQADALEKAVAPTITSDVLAGRDLLVGAAGAALRTVAINLPAVGTGGDPVRTGFEERVERVRQVTARTGREPS